jgi:hypothetical protein
MECLRLPRPPAPAAPRRHEEPAEGSREAIEHELKRSGQKGRKQSRAETEEKLDRAVEMTFPASDPPLPGNPTGNEDASQPEGRHAPRISRDDVERARGEPKKSRSNDLAPSDDAPAGTPSTGEDICPMCTGRGRLDGGSTCPNCAGRGKVIKGIGGARGAGEN